MGFWVLISKHSAGMGYEITRPMWENCQNHNSAWLDGSKKMGGDSAREK